MQFHSGIHFPRQQSSSSVVENDWGAWARGEGSSTKFYIPVEHMSIIGRCGIFKHDATEDTGVECVGRVYWDDDTFVLYKLYALIAPLPPVACNFGRDLVMILRALSCELDALSPWTMTLVFLIGCALVESSHKKTSCIL